MFSKCKAADFVALSLLTCTAFMLGSVAGDDGLPKCSSMFGACEGAGLLLNERNQYDNCEGSPGSDACDTSTGSIDWNTCCATTTTCQSMFDACYGIGGVPLDEANKNNECEDVQAGCDTSVGSNDWKMCCGGNDDDTSNGYVETCSSMDEACSAEDLNLNEWKYYAECEGSNGCDTSIGSNDWKMCCDATKCNSLKKACGDNGLAFNERSFDVECEDTAAGCNATVGSNDFNTCCEVPRCERFTLTKSCDTEAGHQPNQLTKFDTCS